MSVHSHFSFCLGLIGGCFCEFEQDPAGACGMNEDVAMAGSSDLDFISNQAHVFRFECLDGRRQIRNPHADMMKALATLLDVLGDDGIVRGGFEQFESGLTYRNHYQADFLSRYSLLVGNCESKLFVDRLGVCQRFHRDSEMVKCKGHYGPRGAGTCARRTHDQLYSRRMNAAHESAVHHHRARGVAFEKASLPTYPRSPRQLSSRMISSTIEYGSRLCSAISRARRDKSPSETDPRAFSSMASRSISTRRISQLRLRRCASRFSSRK